MAVKVLGQAALGTSLAAIYTVPPGSQAILNGSVCNTTTAALTFRLRHAVNGSGDTPAQAIYQDVSVPANDTFSFSLPISAAAADVLRASGSAAGLSMTLWGNETQVFDPNTVSS